MKVLVINCGSSSVKYKLLEPASGEALAKGKVERIGEDGKTHADAVVGILSDLKGQAIDAVGHRVVHGGENFHDAVALDEDVIAAIEECVPLAPLHNPANLAGIRAARAELPDLPHVGVFDTAFHLRMPRRARTYAIDQEVAAERGIRRFGFHGPSHSYVARTAAKFLGTPLDQLRIVSLHLGNGASACAIEFGHSVETSMGLTPLEGLVMGTRSGDVDPGVVLQLARELGIDATDDLLNRHSGLAGLSGRGNDLRDILEAAAEGDDRSRLAITVFAHRARKYVGAYAAAMGGIDALILTGGIGENSAVMRQRIVQRLDFLGLRIDETRNNEARLSAEAPVADISAEPSRVHTLAVKTDEELMIARETAKLVRGASRVASPGPIPIATSARHLHLDQTTLDALFGAGHELTKFKNISQPGQFAAEERVNLVGPRDRIDGVRVLGPLRGKPQIEISRSDEYHLGIDAPVRRSGRTEGSAPITLEGPAGTVHLEEGLICAWRHIHMTTDDAARHGVSDGDEVEVEITGGPRDLTFGDVLVRVKDSYLLEMHIDTDEANAAELSFISTGDLVYEAAPVGAGATLLQRRSSEED